MNKLIILIALIIIVSPAYTQSKKKKSSSKGKPDPTWFYLGVSGGYGNSVFLCNNTSTDDNIEASYFNPSYGIEGKIGVNFSFGVGLAVELGTSGNSQKYEIISNMDTEGSKANVTSSINSFDKAILLRRSSTQGGYIEIGPKFSKITSSTQSGASSQFKQRYTSIDLGFGGAFYTHEKFNINMGLRLSYALSGLMLDGSYPYGSTDYSVEHYTGNKATNLFSAQLKLGVTWHAGYFQQAKCDRHVEFLFF